jgi:hypothetical protein
MFIEHIILLFCKSARAIPVNVHSLSTFSHQAIPQDLPLQLTDDDEGTFTRIKCRPELGYERC